MNKREIREAIEDRDYWYGKSLLHRTDNDIVFERYDRPLGGIHMEEREYGYTSDYDNCIGHFNN